MENSLDSSNSEPILSGLKSVFKKPANFNAAFEVSINESTTGMQINSSDLDSEITSRSNIFKPSEKRSKSIQGFNVSAQESVLDSEREQSIVMSLKRKSVFAKKQTVDSFNVTYNESNSSHNGGTSLSEESVLDKKTNPFRKSTKNFEMSISPEEVDSNYQISFVDSVDNVESSSILTKPNLFRKSTKNTSDKLQVSENNSVISEKDDSIANVDPTLWITKENPFRNRKSSQDTSNLSLSEHRKSGQGSSNLSLSEHRKSGQDASNLSLSKHRKSGQDASNLSLSEHRKSGQDASNLSLSEHRKSSHGTTNFSLTAQRTCESTRSKSGFIDKEATNLSINASKAYSGSYINESSINDENLNNWMSDNSEDEIPPPAVPPVTKNLSLTKENLNLERVEKSPQKTNWEEKLNAVLSKAQKKRDTKVPTPQKPKPKRTILADNQNKKYRPKKLIKPASFVTKGLYQFILKKFKAKYGVDAILEAEDMVSCISDTVKKVLRRKSYQKSLVQSLKKKMAKAELIETTMDFYEFVIRYLPYDFRVKVVPCLQPVSNTVYPPKEVTNPFDKIL